MENYIVIALVTAIIVWAIGYIVGKKKKGAKCIGCPYCNSCSKNKCEE